MSYPLNPGATPWYFTSILLYGNSNFNFLYMSCQWRNVNCFVHIMSMAMSIPWKTFIPLLKYINLTDIFDQLTQSMRIKTCNTNGNSYFSKIALPIVNANFLRLHCQWQCQWHLQYCCTCLSWRSSSSGSMHYEWIPRFGTHKAGNHCCFFPWKKGPIEQKG